MGNIIIIESVKEIKVSVNQKKYRLIILKDTTSNKKLGYNFFEDKNKIIWDAIIDFRSKKIQLPGKIITILLTKKLFEDLKLESKDLKFTEGESMEIVVWEHDEWMHLDYNTRLKWSLEEQLWKLKVFYNSK